MTNWSCCGRPTRCPPTTAAGGPPVGRHRAARPQPPAAQHPHPAGPPPSGAARRGGRAGPGRGARLHPDRRRQQPGRRGAVRARPARRPPRTLAGRAGPRRGGPGPRGRPQDGPRRGSHLQSWSLSMGTGPDTASPVTVPEERITRWNADGSGSELVVATDPQHPGRPVIHDDDGRWRTVSDGKVLHRATYPAGRARHDGLAARTKPPTDPTALRALLASLYGAADGAGKDAGAAAVPQLLMALSSFRQEWTPGPRETAAIVRMLADTKGLRPVGAVTDRLGRRGQAFVHDGPDGAMDATRQMVILDPRTGQLLGTEITFTRDLPDFRITAGEVMSYEAWMP
ncbi:CU044_5270 family protein [Streptomyces noursei]|nr:CU044_5270 family protein [Streptomyces noursei]